jgi:N-acyl-D-aspartate/D-glutamate deacylase
VWGDPDILLGGSDAGAHLDRMLGSPYPTRFVADCLRGRGLVSLERAVQLMTDVPARLFGLRDRGRVSPGYFADIVIWRVSPGYFADIVIFDPDQIGASPARTSFDLPGESKRLLSDAQGIHRVFVNGVPTIVDGTATGDLPGVVLRSGRDTAGTSTVPA